MPADNILMDEVYSTFIVVRIPLLYITLVILLAVNSLNYKTVILIHIAIRP